VTLAAAVVASQAADEKLECTGGPKQACECLLNCKVFGHHAEMCDQKGDKNAIVDQVVADALQEPGKECDGIKCVVECSAKLKCLDEAVKTRCMHVKESVGSCEVKCDGSFAHPSARVGGVALTAALLSALLGVSGTGRLL